MLIVTMFFIAELFSRCGLCDTYYIAHVKNACAFLGDGMSRIEVSCSFYLLSWLIILIPHNPCIFLVYIARIFAASDEKIRLE